MLPLITINSHYFPDKSQADKVRQKLAKIQIELPPEEIASEDEEDEDFETLIPPTHTVSLLRDIQVPQHLSLF
jgi:hypothetical protein